jgi:hypothetical protein
MSRSKSTRVICDSHPPDEFCPFILTDAALLAIDSDDAPVLTLTTEAQAILGQECRAQRLKRLLRELEASGDELLHYLDKTRAAWKVYDHSDVDARGDFQDATSDFFFLVDAIDRLPEDKSC